MDNTWIVRDVLRVSFGGAVLLLLFYHVSEHSDSFSRFVYAVKQGPAGLARKQTSSIQMANPDHKRKHPAHIFPSRHSHRNAQQRVTWLQYKLKSDNSSYRNSARCCRHFVYLFRVNSSNEESASFKDINWLRAFLMFSMKNFFSPNNKYSLELINNGAKRLPQAAS